jgi:peptide/nickel transport system permease protein
MTLLVAFLAISINFLIPRAMPGDPIEQQLSQLGQLGGNIGDIKAMVQAYRARFGLTSRCGAWYLNYLADVSRGDFGYSLTNYPERVSDAIWLDCRGRSARWALPR